MVTLARSRAFNHISISESAGTLTKRSPLNPAKLIDEIDYQRLLPPDLAVLFPRVTRYSVEWEEPFVEMEFFGYPPLGDAFVAGEQPAHRWGVAFERLYAVLTERFMPHRRRLPKDAARMMYVTKTRERLCGLGATNAALHRLLFSPEPLRLNGCKVSRLDPLLAALQPRLLHLVETFEPAAIHGDLCLSNVLYDFRSRAFKLIDPRGSFGERGIYGDPRYDVAKLYHSIRGRYDFIVQDHFTVRCSEDGSELDLELLPSSGTGAEWYAELEKRFENAFFERFRKADIVLITGLLFASMLPLHAEAPRRQLAMYGMAVAFLSEALSGVTLPAWR